MQLSGTPAGIMRALEDLHPEIQDMAAKVRIQVARLKREVAVYQGAALYALAAPYNKPDAHILEIGTAWGYSTAWIASGAPKAQIITLNPKDTERQAAQKHLRNYGTITFKNALSWDYLVDYHGPELDMIFVDGDHGKVVMDLGWFAWLKPGGLMVFHDYSPADSGRPCPPVYTVVNTFAGALGRKPDVSVVDNANVGLAGFYRQQNEPCPAIPYRGETWHVTPEKRWEKDNV